MAALSRGPRDFMHSDPDEGAALLSGVETPISQFQHKVLNDYNAVIACIFAESSRIESAEVREALSRIADCVHELASSVRDYR